MENYRTEDIKMTEILADDEFNCRGKIDPIDVVDLVKDIEINGLISPVMVCPLPTKQVIETGKQWRLLAGFRRYTAHRVMEREYIRANIRPAPMDEISARLLNLSENFKRKELNILQEAKAIDALRRLGVTETDAAFKLGVSRGWVQTRYMLLDLPEDVQNEVKAGIIKQTNIRELAMINKTGNREALNSAVRQIKEAKAKGEKNVSVAHLALGKTSKRQRNRTEMNHMMDYLVGTVGIGLHTRILAWCNGEITNQELYESLAKYASEKNIEYSIPDIDPWLKSELHGNS